MDFVGFVSDHVKCLYSHKFHLWLSASDDGYFGYHRPLMTFAPWSGHMGQGNQPLLS